MDSRSCWFVARTNRSMVAIGPVIALFTPICLFHSSTLEPMASMSRITRWGMFVTEIAPLAAPITLLVRDAAGRHPELRPLLEDMHADRLRRMTDNARRFSAAGHLRPRITVAEAANVLWTYSSI